MPGPRRIAALVKQVPKFERMELGADGRLQREGIELEMNPYCRRAVAKAVELAHAVPDGEAVVMTMGPPSAEDCLREAIACGTDRGVLLSDRAFAGSDTLATARALAALVEREGPFPLVLVGKNSVDADTGQVGPEVAEILGWSFAGPVRELDVDFVAGSFEALCETDSGHRRVRGELPAVLSCAERLCAPAKADPVARVEVDAGLVSFANADDLGGGPWGESASPTSVGRTRVVEVARQGEVLRGDLGSQARHIVSLLEERGVLGAPRESGFVHALEAAGDSSAVARESDGLSGVTSGVTSGREVWAIVEGASTRESQELAQESIRLAGQVGGSARVVGLGSVPDLLPSGVGEVRLVRGTAAVSDHDYVDVIVPLVDGARPWAILLPSTARGRAVASQIAARLGLGLTGDAVELDVDDDRLVAWKPAFGGRLVAAVVSSSDVQMVTVRPGVLAVEASLLEPAVVADAVDVVASGRVTVLEETIEDDPEILATAPVVIGVGTGVGPSEYGLLEPLRGLLDAELAATRKVTDNGWMPRSRQIGITGRSVAPRLFVSVGASGKFNHACGWRAADFVVAVNADPDAPVFEHADLGVVADWHDFFPLLEAELTRVRREVAVTGT